jgi:anti-sigma B factor antagonist
VPENRLAVLWSGDVAVARMPEEIDVTVADEVRETLLEILNQGASVLVLDMTRTVFCDSAGVSALVRAHRRAGASQADLRLATRSATVLRVFSLVGLTQVLKVYPDVPAALAARRLAARPEQDPGPRSARLPADEM